MLSLGLCHSFKSCALLSSLLFHALFLSPIQTHNVASTVSWRDNQKMAVPLGGKYCIISNLSRYSGLHLPCFLQQAQHQPLSVTLLRVGDRHTLPARSLSVGIPSKETGLPGIMFATLGVSLAGCLGPNPYHSSKVTNLPLDQFSTPFLWNIQSVASYQFVLKPPLTNSYNQDPDPL